MYDRPAKILNIASTAGITSRPGWLAYASSKAAVVSLSATLADELAGSGIKVYSISPGRTATELRRKLAPEEDPSTIMQPQPRRRRHRPADARRRDHPRRAEHHRPHAGLTGRVNRLEYLLASTLLRLVRLFFVLLPRAPRPRSSSRPPACSTLDGNLLYIHRRDPRAPSRAARSSSCSSRTATAWRGKLAYLGRLVRGMYHLQTAGLFVVDNAYLPIHVAPAPADDDGRPGLACGRRAQAVRAGHADAARRARADLPASLLRRGRRRRRVDAGPYAAALRTPIERVLALGSPRTDFFFDETRPGRRPGERVLARLSGAGRPAGRPLRADLPGPRHRQAGGPGPRRASAPGRPPGRPRARPQDAPEPRSDRDPDRRLRRRRRPDGRDQRPAWR